MKDANAVIPTTHMASHDHRNHFTEQVLTRVWQAFCASWCSGVTAGTDVPLLSTTTSFPRTQDNDEQLIPCLQTETEHWFQGLENRNSIQRMHE